MSYTLSDLDKFADNPKLVKEYHFKISATDMYQNHSEATFVVKVSDTDLPEISANAEYLIVVSVSEDLSRERIIEILTRANNLKSYEITSIESDYFSDELSL